MRRGIAALALVAAVVMTTISARAYGQEQPVDEPTENVLVDDDSDDDSDVGEGGAVGDGVEIAVDESVDEALDMDFEDARISDEEVADAEVPDERIADQEFGDDLDAAADDLFSVEGSARGGWRMLTGRGRGRFLQDVDLGEGLRLFELDARVTDEREDAFFDEYTATAHDLGERSTDASLALRRGNELLVEGTYFREIFTYRADGDPFPRDTTRDRYNTRIRYSPQPGLTFRFAWDRSDRSGESYSSSYTDAREQPPPQGVDPEKVSTKRPFDETFDTLTAGADVVWDGWRLGLTTSWRRARISDERRYDAPSGLRGNDSLNESFTRRTDSTSTSVVGKIGRSFLDGLIDSTLFLTYMHQPVNGSLGGSANGVDGSFEDSAPRGAYSSTSDGDTDIDRNLTSWELETSWQVTDDLEAIVSVGQEDVIDDAELSFSETRLYERPDIGPRTTRTYQKGRTTNRMDRVQVDLLYELTREIDLRGGYERLGQDTKAPFETQGESLEGSTLNSVVERFSAGFDVTPLSRLKISVLGRRGRDDEPPAAPSPETADELNARVRYTATESLSMSGVYRYRGFHQNSEFDSSTRAESTGLALSWDEGPLRVEFNATRQTLDTATDTSFFVLDSVGFRQIDEDVAYRTRDLVLSLHSEYEISARMRASLGGNYLRSRGTEELHSNELVATFEVDLNETVTAGLTGRVWHYEESETSDDDYDAEALEIWLELHF